MILIHKYTYLNCFSFQRNARLVPTFCDHCGYSMWGTNCYQCTICKLTAHERCYKLFPANCGISEKAFNETLLKIHSNSKDGSEKKSVKFEDMNNSEHLDNFSEMLKNLKNPKDESSEEQEKFKVKINRKITGSNLFQQISQRSDLNDFKILKVLGEGAFGKVYLVENKDSKDVLAMKVMFKEEIIRGDDVDTVLRERKVFEYGKKSNFLASLHSSFQSLDKLFFVMEFLPGGDLLFHITKIGRFTSIQARFYAAELYLAVNHLHKNNIIHRDLKLENILLDKNGHLKLTDFGVSKLEIARGECTGTRVGTPNYQAPEIVKAYNEMKGGYTEAVDWWSYGVVLYEVQK